MSAKQTHLGGKRSTIDMNDNGGDAGVSAKRNKAIAAIESRRDGWAAGVGKDRMGPEPKNSGATNKPRGKGGADDKNAVGPQKKQ